MTLNKEEVKKVNLNIKLLKLKDYVNDMQVGYVEVILNDQIFHKEPIYVSKKEIAKEKNWWQKFRSWLFNG